jgi:hypothetical protein
MKLGFEDYTPEPNQMQQALALVRLMQHCDAQKVCMSIFGGYGLDALYGKLTRDHSDFDLVIENEAEDHFVKILAELDYEYLPERSDPGRKAAYRQRDLDVPFKLEYATLDSSKLVQMVNQLNFSFDHSLFFPSPPNGQLLGYPLRTPTIAGVEIIMKIQEYATQELGWPPYKHLQHQESLLRVLKARR